MFGTLDILSLLINQDGYRTIAEFGEDNLWQQTEEYLQIHNRLTGEMRGDLIVNTTAQQVRWGGLIDEGEMHPVDEYGRSDAERVEFPLATNGLPLRKFDRSVQWTRDYFRTKTVREFALQMQAIGGADLRNIRRQIRRGLYLSTNNLTYVDREYDGTSTYAVRALLNGDGQPIPVNQEDGTTFPSNHTHYIASAGGVTTAAMDALINLIIEHGVVGEVRVEIAQAQETAVRGLAGFIPYTDPRLMSPNTVGVGEQAIPNQNRLQVYNPRNRAIGIYGSAEIWVKPYAIAGYIVARDTGKRPLAWRTRPNPQGTQIVFGNLEIAAEDERYPLRARTVLREFGIGVNDRAAAAILYVGGGTYVNPTIP